MLPCELLKISLEGLIKRVLGYENKTNYTYNNIMYFCEPLQFLDVYLNECFDRNFNVSAGFYWSRFKNPQALL